MAVARAFFLCLGLGFISLAQANGIRVDVSGTITEVDYTVPNPSVSVGDAWSVSVFIPEDQLPSAVQDYHLVYTNFDGALNFAGQSIALGHRPAANGGTALSLADATNTDQFNINAIIANEPRDTVDGYELNSFGLDLRDPTIFTYPGPPQIEDLFGLGAADFRSGSLFIVYANPYTALWQGEVDFFQAQVVPVPAAFWLFASGLGLLGGLRKKETSTQWQRKDPRTRAGATRC